MSKCTLQSQALNPARKPRSIKPKKSDIELIQNFWGAPDDALFGQETIAPVTNRNIKTLECDRWKNNGIPYRKCGGRVLYRKADVITWINSHQLVTSTSDAKLSEGKIHVA